MIFFSPFSSIFMIYLLAAILPAAFLLYYIYKEDYLDKEPGYLLKDLVICGFKSALAAIIIELVVARILPMFFDISNISYVFIDAFIGIALVEETCKFYFLKKRTYHDFNFNYTFDGIVYAVFVSLGFALLENIQYVFTYGLNVAFTRAITAIPAHMAFGVVMGYFYARYKMHTEYYHPAKAKINLIMSIIAPIVLHGIYDSLAMINTSNVSTLFFIFIILLFVLVYYLVKKEKREDHLI